MRWLSLALLLGVVLSACATGPGIAYSTMAGSYPYHERAFHIKIHWIYKDQAQEPVTDVSKFAARGKTLLVQGIVENTSGSTEVFDVELNILIFDRDGKFLGSVKGGPKDYILQPGQISPFVIPVALAGNEERLGLKESYEWREISRH